MPFSIRPSCRLSRAYFFGSWLLIILLVMSSATAYAGWELFSGDDASEQIVYADSSTIRQTGDKWYRYNSHGESPRGLT